MPCKFPEHHKSGSRGSGIPVSAVAAVIVAVFLAAKRHAIAHGVGIAVHDLVLLVVALAAVAAVAAVVLPRLPGRWRYLHAAVWARVKWRWLARNLGCAFPDRRKQGKTMFPRTWIYPGVHGIVARLRTIPGVDREALEGESEHIRNAWRCARVRVSQSRPGRLVIHGYRTDPLAAPLDVSALPQFDGRHLYLGRDEFGDLRRVSLANLSGCAFSGNPGRGKTEAALSLACQLAASDLVEFYVLDGGACDWAPFAAGAAGYAADDLDAAADLLHELAAGMSQRRRTLEADLGVRNGWKVGPTPDYRLRWLLLEEAPFYLDPGMVKGDKRREALVATCQGLVGGLLRRGRAPMIFTSLIAQKGTGTGGLPPDLRDLCGLRWSFGVATLQAASAVLGAEISQYPSLSPVLLQDRPGIATALLPTGTSPYTLLRFPEVGEARADEVAAALTANLRSGRTQAHQPQPENVSVPALRAV